MKKILFVVFIAALVLSACSSNEFERNHQLWRDANISHYRFELSIGCFCPFRNQMPLTVEVQNGEVVSMIDPNGVVIAEDDPSYETFLAYGTIDTIFEQLGSDLNGDVDEVQVTYDATYGFPNAIFRDMIKEAVDDELSISVSAFEVLP